MTQQEQISQQTVVFEEAVEETLAQKLASQKKLQKKKRFKKIAILSGVLFFCYIVYWGLAPFQGTVGFAVCKTFLELNLSYPSTLRISEVNYLRDGSIRLWFTHIDAFGSYRMEPFQCFYKPDEATGAILLEKIKIGTADKVFIDPVVVESYNKYLPFLMASKELDLTAPAPLPDPLAGITFDITRFTNVNLGSIRWAQ